MLERADLIALVGESAATLLLVGFGADPPAGRAGRRPQRTDDGLGRLLTTWWTHAATSLVSPAKGGGAKGARWGKEAAPSTSSSSDLV